MNASNVSPVSALLNAEASLVNAVAATTEKVKQVATSALPSALAELHNAVEEAKARIQSAAMLYRATLADLTFDIGSFTSDILSDLDTATTASLPGTVAEQVPSLPVTVATPTAILNTTEQEASKEEVSEVVVSTAANPPVEKVPVASPRKPLEGERKGKVTPDTSGRGKAPRGKGRAKKSGG